MAANTKEAIQSVLSTLPHIQQLKLEQEDCITNFIAGKDIVALLPMGHIHKFSTLYEALHECGLDFLLALGCGNFPTKGAKMAV